MEKVAELLVKIVEKFRRTLKEDSLWRTEKLPNIGKVVEEQLKPVMVSRLMRNFK